MEKYGLPKGLIWQSSERTGGRDMDDEDMLEWMQSIEQVEQVRLRTDSTATRSRFGEPQAPRMPEPSSSKPVESVKVHEMNGLSSEISPLERRAGQPGSPSNPNIKKTIPFFFGSSKTSQAFVFGSESTYATTTNAHRSSPGQPGSPGPSSEFSFRHKTAVTKTIEPYRYCGFCRFILQKARALRLRPPKCTASGFGLHIEGGGCICCDNNDLHGQQQIDLFPYPHDTLEPVRTSARDGCHLCSILVGRETPLDEPVLGSGTVLYRVAVQAKQSYDGPGKIVLERLESQPQNCTTLRTIALQYDLIPKTLSSSLQYATTDSQPMYAMAKEWLRKCREEHEVCNETITDKGFLPTRLIQIASTQGEVRSLKLCVTSDLLDRDISYLALSHRWGGDSINLSSENYDSFLKDIPIRSLPRNFVDATRITANLGFSFLWIDSLTIIQDSPVDKAREIPVMSEIYGHAVLTIAALATKDSNGGCFMSRYPLSMIPALLRDGESGARDAVWAEPERSRGPRADGGDRPPLHTRGWVVQERALAQRTLNFGADMVHWQCVEAAADEASPQMTMETVSPSASTNRIAMGLGLNSTFGMVHMYMEHGREYDIWSPFWWRIVREYTASNLTYESDKWNAISSLATQIECASRRSPAPNRLFFGLWERNLSQELMWKIRKPGNRVDPAEFNAPTWSWLSVDAAVVEQRFDFGKVHVQLATATVDTGARLSFDGLGATNKAIVHGCLFELKLEIKPGREGHRTYEFQSAKGRAQTFSKDDYAFMWWPDAHVQSTDGLAILPVARGRHETDACYGLVIQPSDAAKLSWSRVGCFQLTPVGRARPSNANRFDGERMRITLE